MLKIYSILSLATALLFIFYFSPAQSAVIGLDLGSEYMKISSISPGKSFYIIEDTTTKRKTPTAIAFYGNERIYEYDTFVKRPKAYQTTFVNLPKFLGKDFNDDKVKQHLATYFEDYILQENERGTLSFGLKSFKMGNDDEESYLLKIEELVGMVFRHIKELSEDQTGRALKDIVVAIPPYWNFRERYALHDALILADLNPLAFIHENTAAALYYALERQDEETHTMILYNMGSTSTKVSLVEFYLSPSTDKYDKNAKIETFKVLAEAWDENLGGLTFDTNVVKHFANEFDSKPARKGEKSVLTSLPARAKLLREVNRLKEILSANKQSQIYLENLFDSTDFKHMLERPAFDEINTELYKRLTKPIDEVLERANKTLKDVNAFELIGGGIRIPKVQQVLGEYLGDLPVSTHLNGDESMALGAAFHAANLSASFKTRQINLNDGYNFDIRVELRDLEPQTTSNAEESTALNKSAVLFPYKTRYGTKKILAFEHAGDVNASFFATLPGENAEQTVVSFAITGLNESLAEDKFKGKDLGKPKIHLHFRLTPLGFIELAQAEATVEEIILYQEPAKNATTKTTDATESKLETEGDDATADADADADSGSAERGENGEANFDEEQPVSKADDDEDLVDNSGSSTSQTTAEPEQTTTTGNFKRKTITHHIPLTVNTVLPRPGPMTEDEITTSKGLLARFDHYEEQKKKTAEAKNRLEAFLYSTRDALEEEGFLESTKSEEKEQLDQMLSEHRDWLESDEAYKANHSPFNKRYEDMHKVFSKIAHRVEQRLKRSELIEKARFALNDLINKTKEVRTTKNWVTEEATEAAVNQIKEIQDWFHETIGKQEELPHNEDPILTTSGVSVKIERAKEIFNKIKNTLKPKAAKNGTDTDSPYDFSGFKMGPDGKFDEEALKAYFKKMNVTYNNNATSGDNETVGDDETNDFTADDTTTHEGDKTATRGDAEEPRASETTEKANEAPQEEPAAREPEPEKTKKDKKKADPTRGDL